MQMRPEFPPAAAFDAMVGWEVHEIRLIGFHVMVFFNNGSAFLNVASRFSHSAPGVTAYTVDIYGPDQAMLLTRIIGRTIMRIARRSFELDIIFERGDIFTVHYDDWSDTHDASWWILEFADTSRSGSPTWEISAESGLR